MKKLKIILELKNSLGIQGRINFNKSGRCYILQVGDWEWVKFEDTDILQVAIDELSAELEEKKRENLKTIDCIEKRIA